MVHFPGFARARLWIHRAVRRFYQRGFPHSDIPESKPACGSSRLIAACHVLHRHLLPRHPPCALSNLTIKFTQSTQRSAFSDQPKPLELLLTANSYLPIARSFFYDLIVSAHRGLLCAVQAQTNCSPVCITGPTPARHLRYS